MEKEIIDEQEMQYIVKQAKKVTLGIIILIVITAIIYFKYGR